MSKPTDSRIIDGAKRRSSSSSKPGEITDIPKIILDQRRNTSSSLPSSLQASSCSNALAPTTHSGSLPDDVSNEASGDNRVGAKYLCTGNCTHMPVRSSSDIGLPTVKSPCLVPAGGFSSHDNHIEVFCSPRTLRKSVDSNINTKEHLFYQWEKVQTIDSSNSCLKVLTSGSRAGSALSLNSECTARSIGLLSSDSDSDKDLSLAESDKARFKPAQLRRFMSYPDEDFSPELCARSSQSLGDLISSDNTDKGFNLGMRTACLEADSSSSLTGKSESTSVSVSNSKPDSVCELNPIEQMGAHAEDLFKDRDKSNTGLPTNMLSYKCDSHNSSRDIRIRQWLEDMNSDR
ncbi:unnamed protein product [Candidula unifasciata]|uniref:Uncharacterized protein n=1 Tax=Candidula unifasciata TaxID=100452 RepID=A0A8S3YGC4_9EUPU|nr:unnamed protein product [Candidula unifasciata]